MAEWITVFCKRSVGHLSPRDIHDGIAGPQADLATRAELFEIDQEQVEPALSFLRIENLGELGFDRYRLYYRAEEMRQVDLLRIAIRTDVQQFAMETLERLKEADAPAADRVRAHLADVTEVVSLELGWSQLGTMAEVFAYEVARFLGGVGEGLMQANDGGWWLIQDGAWTQLI